MPEHKLKIPDSNFLLYANKLIKSNKYIMSKKSLLTEESPFIVIVPSSIISLQRLKVTKSQQLVSLIKGSAKTLESLKNF